MGDDVPIYTSDSDSERENTNSTPLSDEQSHALDAAKKGRNIFITGSAGVGKSFLLKEILKVIPKETAYVTASTGVAACNIGGTTLHSFAGIGLGDKSAKILASNINSKFKVDAKRRWLGCRVLVIDEISMIDGHLFEKVEKVAQLVRRNTKPFGGIQVILCGDFLQLPPVKSQYFAFETKAWSEVIEETIVLKKVFRQKDIGLITLLHRLRTGQFTPLDVEVLETCKNTKFIDDGIKATRLFPHRYSCDHVNTEELAKLKGASVTYKAIDSATRLIYSEMLEKNSKFPSKLELKSGAQVMLLVNKNVKGHLVNGARGVVIGFRDRSKSLEENLDSILKESKEDNHLGALGGKDMLENTIVISEDEDEDESEDNDDDSSRRSPIVLYAIGVVDVVNAERLTIDVAGKTVASRTQIPLSLAWAVSIHKSQGMTLDRIDVNIAESFEHGQSYVALSRVTSLDGLLLRDFNARKITAHPKVLGYYKKIDPTFDKFAIEGDEQLKTFIEGKKKLEGYEELLQEIKDRNEAGPSCSYSKDKISLSPNTNNATNYIDVKNRLASDFKPFVSKAQAGMDSKLLISTDKDDCTRINEVSRRPTCTSVKPENSTTEEVGILSGDIKVEEGTSTRPLTTCKALLKAESCLADCRKALENAKAGPSNFFANENLSCLDNSKKSGDKSFCRSIVIDSDSDDAETSDDHFPSHNESDIKDLDLTIFDKDDFDDSLHHDSTGYAANNFLNNICPDLLQSTDSLTRDNVLHHISKRKRTEQENNVKTSKRIVDLHGDHITTLLKAKSCEIENKKKAALERRRRSLQQRLRK